MLIPSAKAQNLIDALLIAVNNEFEADERGSASEQRKAKRRFEKDLADLKNYIAELEQRPSLP